MAKRYGMLVDIAYCIGCGVCVTACKQENNLPPGAGAMPWEPAVAWNQVLSISEGGYPYLRVHYFPVQCMHCAQPPCIAACPRNAIDKRDDGIVLINQSRCNACEDQPGQMQRCVPSCPYGAIQISPQQQAVQACTFCIHRLEAQLEPACVRACPGRCLIFGDLNDSETEIAQKVKESGDRLFTLKPEDGCGPSVFYISPDGDNLDRVSHLARIKSVYGYGSDYVKPAM